MYFKTTKVLLAVIMCGGFFGINGVAQEYGEPIHRFREEPLASSDETRALITEVFKFPEVKYPAFANFFKVPGYCEVQVDIRDGDEMLIRTAQCSDKLFCRSAIESMKTAVIRTKYEDGLSASRKGIIWPIQFSIPGKQDASRDLNSLVYCTEDSIS